jgi:predicted transcriptional regulator
VLIDRSPVNPTRCAGTVGHDMSRVHRQLASLARNGLIRPGADDRYADGDDAAWKAIDWRPRTARGRGG